MKVDELLVGFDKRLLTTPEGRRALTRFDPMLFALIYLPHKLKAAGSDTITVSEFHVALAEYGKSWAVKDSDPNGHWAAHIAPRGCGKSTWLFHILPLWAAAHEHRKFAAAFSDAANQAEGHLLNFKMELRTNDLLQSDYPDLCEPMKEKRNNRTIADSAWRTIRKNGFIFDANGVDTNALGKNALGMRPDLIILDDIEKGEKNYSEYQATRQRNTVIDDISPMGSPGYHMVFVGTTTMPNSVMDQLRKYADGYHEDKDLVWIKERNVKVNYFPAILGIDSGEERSIWPEKWSLEWLQGERHKRYFAKNFMNKPVNVDGEFWDEGDIGEYEEGEYGNTILSLDPAVTRNKVSDYSGIAVVSRGFDKDGKPRIYVREAIQVKLSPEGLKERVKVLCEQYDVGLILCETNQGGDLWKSLFKDVGVKYVSKHQTDSKTIRAARALNHYQQDKIRHTKSFPALEEQMWAFPKVSHDDVLDAVVSGVLFFLNRKRQRVTVKQLNYN